MKGKGCNPTSQLEKINYDFSTSTIISPTTQPIPIIEENVFPVHKSQEEKKKQKYFTERMRYQSKKKATRQPTAKKTNAKKFKVTRTSITTSTTTQPGPSIEEHVLSVSNNQYHVSKSQDDKKKQKAFTARMRYKAKKKALEQIGPKKPKLTRAQELKNNTETPQAQYNISTPTKNIHVENNKSVLPFLGNKNVVYVPISTSTIHVITPIKI